MIYVDIRLSINIYSTTPPGTRTNIIPRRGLQATTAWSRGSSPKYPAQCKNIHPWRSSYKRISEQVQTLAIQAMKISTKTFKNCAIIV